MTRRFRFGVAVGLVPNAEALVDIARRIERLGYSTMVVADGLWVPSPFSILSAAAAATSRLRLATHVLAAPLRAPAAVAQEVDTIDLVSGHRFELGLGTGQPNASLDADRLGVPFGTRSERLARVAEAISTVRRRFAAAEKQPPKILLAGVGRKLVDLATREADTLALPVSFDRTEDGLTAKVDELSALSGSRLERLELGTNINAVGDKEPPEWVPSWFRPPADSYSWLRGTTARVADTLRRRRDRTGISYLTIPQWHVDDFAPVVQELAGS